VKSARYRPPGFSRLAAPKRAVSAPGLQPLHPSRGNRGDAGRRNRLQSNTAAPIPQVSGKWTLEGYWKERVLDQDYSRHFCLFVYQFIRGLFKDAFNISDYIPSRDRMIIINEIKTRRGEWSSRSLRYCSRIYLELLRKTTKIQS
jgi:hypothetical protein